MANDTDCNKYPNNNCNEKDTSTNCFLYTGDDLECSNIKKNTLLNDVIFRLDKFICDKFQEVKEFFSIINIGLGAKIFKGLNLIGEKELRTISTNQPNRVDIVEGVSEIFVDPGQYTVAINGNTLELTVTTTSGSETTSATLPVDVHLNSATLDPITNILALELTNGTNITVDLTDLKNDADVFLDSATINNGTKVITLTLTNGTTYNIDLTTVTQQTPQVKSDYIELDPNSDAFIQNKNPQKTVTLTGTTLDYTLLTADNNYTIEINNGANNVTITIPITIPTANYFVGLIQKGTGTVTINGFDIKPSGFQNVMFGAGHIAAVEVVNSTKYLHGNLKEI